jgi:hypothetical protein
VYFTFYFQPDNVLFVFPKSIWFPVFRLIRYSAAIVTSVKHIIKPPNLTCLLYLEQYCWGEGGTCDIYIENH